MVDERIRVFFCEETPFIEVRLRRFTWSADDPACQHDASSAAPIGRFEWPVRSYLEDHAQDIPRDHPLWPKNCEKCAYEFQPGDEWQAFTCRVMRRTDTGEDLPVVRHLSDLPVGAVYECWWRPKRAGFDGRSLAVNTPGGQWMVDERASNCTKPADQVHRCWVRHGRPEDGTMHVDKAGNTCSAGAGSIIAGDYHGFLHNGHLIRC